MKKPNYALVVLLLIVAVVGVGVFFPQLNLLQILTKPTLLVIQDDQFAADSTLTNYLNAKSTNYSVTRVSVSSIPAIPETRTFIKFSSIESISFPDPAPAILTAYLCNDDVSPKAIAKAWININDRGWSWVGSNRLSGSVELGPYVTGRRDFTINYNGGSTVTVKIANLPSMYESFGRARILPSGDVAFRRTRADDIRDFIMASGTQYVLLVGGPAVPGFDLRCLNVQVEFETFTQDMTDHPFRCRDIYTSNKEMVPVVAVGRLSARTTAELDIMLNKLSGFQPYESKKVLMWNSFEGLSSSGFSSWVSSVQTVMPDMTMTSYFYPSADTVVAALNSGFDFVLACAHGSSQMIDPITRSQVMSLNSPISSIVFFTSCSVGVFSYAGRGPAEAFLLNPNSGTCAAFGAVIPSSLNGNYLSLAFCSSVADTIGMRYVEALTNYYQADCYGRLMYNFFGDPTMSFTQSPIPEFANVLLILFFIIATASTVFLLRSKHFSIRNPLT